MRKIIISILVTTSLLVSFMLFAEESFARAGGGISSSSSSFSDRDIFTDTDTDSDEGGTFIFILFVMCFFAMGVIAYFKNKKCNELLEKLSAIDGAWDPNALKDRIETIYYKVQTAWKERNQDLARDYMSKRLYEKHKIQTDEMLKKGHKPMMFDIYLAKAIIVEVTDFEDDSRDRFCALIIGSMIDYVIDEKTRENIMGVDENQSFKEFWRFVREGDSWVLDEIDQTATSIELMEMVASSEAIA